ncbi:DMT family transporter [Rubellimicrobium sp. CFH 75288]|uniref:DMT family transporter n=1 Tax=Rubellimicrobium sp. CFH 75288 TaxID=2697034 RepID=UPI0014122C8D|nr:EamA-like transporter family protein [Rubellimicrobium sp. CFH 75288]
MIAAALMALGAGVLVALSRQVNARLALGSSALGASLWNHATGLAALVVAGAALGAVGGAGLRPQGSLGAVPVWAWAGGPLGVVFVAAGAWCVARIGAGPTATLMIAGQMLGGAALDLAAGAAGTGWRLTGVGLILLGVAAARR